MNKMKMLLPVVFLVCFAPISLLKAQTDDKAEILKARSASNDALRAYDDELSYTYLTDNVLITTGNGTLISGKEALREYVKAGGVVDGERMFWIRTPNELIVNESRGLAWESGRWKGFLESAEEVPVIGGNYSAQWVKKEGKWYIQSQLFVTLE